MNGVVIFTLDDRSYGLPIEQVERVVRAVELTAFPLVPACVAGGIVIEGEAVPVFNVRRRLGLPEREVEPDDQLIVARLTRRRVALMVDEAVDVSDSSGQAPLPPPTADGPDCICGHLNGGTGAIPIIDLNRFLSVEEETALDRAMNP